MEARGEHPSDPKVYTKERRGSSLKRINWVLVVLVLIGFVIGRFIGTYFDGTFLNYGQKFRTQQSGRTESWFYHSYVRAGVQYYHSECDRCDHFVCGISFYPLDIIRRRRQKETYAC